MPTYMTAETKHNAEIPHQGQTELLSGDKSAAYGALVSQVSCTPFFPITPQTEIMETFAQWRTQGVYRGQYRTMESEHSVMSAAIGSQMCGQRTFTASSSQGLMLMLELLPIAAGNRLPLVMANVSRALAAPITLWSDHNDFMMCRDTGFIMYICETNQEILDSVVIAYRVGEDRRVLLPSVVNLDGFTQSFTREPVHIPSREQIEAFLPPLHMEVRLDTSRPMTLGMGAGADDYMAFKQQMRAAMNEAVAVIEESCHAFARITGRRYALFEQYMMQDARYAIVGVGANATIMKSGVRKLRDQGVPVGLVRPRVIRPFAGRRLADILAPVQRVAVIDQNLSPGSGGILYHEVCSALRRGPQEVVNNYIAGLGGRPLRTDDIVDLVNDLLQSEKDGLKWVL